MSGENEAEQRPPAGHPPEEGAATEDSAEGSVVQGPARSGPSLDEASLDEASLDPSSPDEAPVRETPLDSPAPAAREPEGKGAGNNADEMARKGAYHVALPAFEGPLDLLLHLIQQHELDIKDIPIAFISEKYLEYITLMQDLNIDLASEYLVMAATLAHIKSKMLLPKPPADQDDDSAEDLDPRGELVRRLLEYQKYKDAAEQLGEAPVLGRDVFVRGAPAPSVDGPAPLAQVSVFKLFDAFQRLLSKVQQTAEHLIDVDRISISERIIELTDLLKDRGRTPFEELFAPDSPRSDLIVTFLALLEMTRLRMMQVIQDEPLAPILVELTLAEEHEEILGRGLSTEDPLTALARGDVQELESVDTAAADEPEPSETESVTEVDTTRVED